MVPPVLTVCSNLSSDGRFFPRNQSYKGEYGTSISEGASDDTGELWETDLAFVGTDRDKVGDRDRHQYDLIRDIYHDVHDG